MRLIEATGKAYRVVVEKTGEEVFSDDRETCLRFIRGFDKATPEYVGLLMFDPSGKEDKYYN